MEGGPETRGKKWKKEGEKPDKVKGSAFQVWSQNKKSQKENKREGDRD